jgi:hypothetical protein
MKTTKTALRITWLREHADEIAAALSTPRDHATCKGDCHNGATCHAQSGGGYGWWAKAFAAAGYDPYARPYWSGSAPTPSTSIDKRLVGVLSDNYSNLVDMGID